MNTHKNIVVELINVFAPNGVGIEIGVYAGETSHAILKDTTAQHLYLIDPWIKGSEEKCNRHYLQVCKLMNEEFSERTTIIRKKSEDATEDVPNDLGFVFIDGDHHYDYVMNDLTLWVPKVRSGGLIVGHDWGHDFPEVIQAVVDYSKKGTFETPLSNYDKLAHSHVSAPSHAPVVNKSWPYGKLWWAIKK